MANKLILIVNAKSNVLNQREEYIKHFKKKFQLTIVCPDTSSLKKEQPLQGINFRELSLSRSGKSIFTELKTLRRLYQIVKTEGTNAVFHAYTIKPILYLALINKIAFRGKLKTYSTFTGLGYLFINKDSNRLLRFAVCKLLKFCFSKSNHRVIFQNPDDQQLFIKLGITNNMSQVILGSGVDTDFYKFQPQEKRTPIQFLFIGRLLTDKGLTELLTAFSNFLKANPQGGELRIAGDADPNNPNGIKDDVFQSFLGQNIKYIGYQSDIRATIIESDVVVLPSYREGVPLSLIQACSIGRPIIASDAPGCREAVIDRKNGYLVEAKSVSSIENALNFFTKQSPKEWTSFGEESRKLATGVFSSEVVNAKIESLYIQDLKL